MKNVARLLGNDEGMRTQTTTIGDTLSFVKKESSQQVSWNFLLRPNVPNKFNHLSLRVLNLDLTEFDLLSWNCH